MSQLLLAFIASIIILMASSLVSAIRIMYLSSQLLKYIKNNDYNAWVHITSIGRFGPGLVNNFRYKKYVTKMKNKDNFVAKHADKIKIASRYFYLFMLAAIVNFFLVCYLIRKS